MFHSSDRGVAGRLAAHRGGGYGQVGCPPSSRLPRHLLRPPFSWPGHLLRWQLRGLSGLTNIPNVSAHDDLGSLEVCSPTTSTRPFDWLFDISLPTEARAGARRGPLGQGSTPRAPPTSGRSPESHRPHASAGSFGTSRLSPTSRRTTTTVGPARHRRHHHQLEPILLLPRHLRSHPPLALRDDGLDLCAIRRPHLRSARSAAGHQYHAHRESRASRSPPTIWPPRRWPQSALRLEDHDVSALAEAAPT